MLRTGIRWMRFVPLFLAMFITLQIFDSTENLVVNLAILALLIVLFFRLGRARRLEFDRQNFYIIKGPNETVIPFLSIKSIKRSSAKVNGSRYWIMIYSDEAGYERKCRYFSSFTSKKFHKKVREANTNLVFWSHPFFNH